MTVSQAPFSNHSETKLEFAGTGEVLLLVLVTDISGCPWAETYNREVPTDQNAYTELSRIDRGQLGAGCALAALVGRCALTLSRICSLGHSTPLMKPSSFYTRTGLEPVGFPSGRGVCLFQCSFPLVHQKIICGFCLK